MEAGRMERRESKKGNEGKDKKGGENREERNGRKRERMDEKKERERIYEYRGRKGGRKEGKRLPEITTTIYYIIPFYDNYPLLKLLLFDPNESFNIYLQIHRFTLPR